MSQDEVDKVLPPPTWKTLFKRELVGEGFGKSENGYLKNAPHVGKDLLKGDRMIITGKEFMYKASGWQKAKKKAVIPINAEGNYLTGIKAPMGQQITVEGQRLETSY